MVVEGFTHVVNVLPLILGNKVYKDEIELFYYSTNDLIITQSDYVVVKLHTLTFLHKKYFYKKLGLKTPNN